MSEDSNEFDWHSAEISEKYDGNLCVLFNYLGEWLVSSKSIFKLFILSFPKIKYII